MSGSSRTRPVAASAVVVALLVVAAWLLFPSPRGFVVDEAELIDVESEEHLERLAEALLEDTGVELVTMTVDDLGGEEIGAYALRRFEASRVGESAPDGRGLLLLVALRERQVRLEVSYSLEGVLPDIFVGYLEREQMAPYFEDRLVGGGIEATVELLAGRVFEASRADPVRSGAVAQGPLAGGAGAAARVATTGGAGSDRSGVDDVTAERFGAQPSAESAWSAFLEIQRLRIKDPALGLYDRASSEILRRRPNSNAGQDHIYQLYHARSHEVRQQGDLAAVVFPVDPDYQLAPWFFRRDEAGWRLDGSMYPDAIGYNHLNQWHFVRRDHDYTFAFEDFRIDRHGFATHAP